MKAKEIEVLESYFNTDNEHWNSYAFAMLCEILRNYQFENPETPLLLFSKAIDIFTEHYKTPLKAVQVYTNEASNENLDPAQKLFVYETVYNYISETDLSDEGLDFDDIESLLNIEIENLKNKVISQGPENKEPLVGNIRDTLKELMQKELEKLPKTLKDLEPIQRLNVLCKLIPYVLPKVEAVHSEKGEPDQKSKASFTGFDW